jgi:hypothetical protein
MARSAQARQLAARMHKALSAVFGNVMLAVSESIEAASPVKTGHLQSNFVLSTGSRYGSVDGSPRAVSHVAQKGGKSRIESYDVTKDGPLIFLTNNVNYLEFHRGFVTFALQSGAARISQGGEVTNRALKSLAKGAAREGA